MRLERVSATYLLGLPSLPGICPAETEVIFDYLRICERFHSRFSINVPVGPGDTTSAPLSAAIDRMWASITRRKIDLLEHASGFTFVVEVKQHARMSTVTQVLRYRDLYAAAHPDLRHCWPCVLCRSHVPGVERVLEANHGDVRVVPRAPLAREVSA